jgi:hypothetical protein
MDDDLLEHFIGTSLGRARATQEAAAKETANGAGLAKVRATR